MPTDDPLTITLPADVSNRIRAETAENGYTDPLDVIEDGLDALDPHGEAIQRWLREEVGPACDELDRDPSQVLTMEESAAALQSLYSRSLKAG